MQNNSGPSLVREPAEHYHNMVCSLSFCRADRAYWVQSITGISVSQDVRDLNAQLGKRDKACTFNWFTAVIAADAKDGLVKDDVAASKDESYDAFLKAVTKDNVPRLGRFEFVFSTEEGRESDKIIELFWSVSLSFCSSPSLFSACLRASLPVSLFSTVHQIGRASTTCCPLCTIGTRMMRP